MMKWSWIVWVAMVISSCSSDWKNNSLIGYRSSDLALSELYKNEYSVLFFLGPECPLCENYALNFNNLHDEFASQSMKFYGIFSGQSYSAEDILKYKDEFGIKMPFYGDPDFSLAKGVHATVTPEVVVLDSDLNKVYSGAIDNWAVTVRKHRQVITERYLHSVLTALKNDKKPPYSQTEPVGCFIE